MLTITPQTPDVALPLAAFLRRRYAPARRWPRAILLGWVRWHLGEGFLAYVLDGEQDGVGRIVAVGVARPVMRPEDGREDYRHDPEGSCLFVDVAVSTAPRGLLCLVALLRRRFGFRRTIAYQRRNREAVVARPFLPFHRKVFPCPDQSQPASSHP